MERSTVAWRAADDGLSLAVCVVVGAAWALIPVLGLTIGTFVRGGDVLRLVLVGVGLVAAGMVCGVVYWLFHRRLIVEVELEPRALTVWRVNGRVTSHRVGALTRVTWYTTTAEPWMVAMRLRIDGRTSHTRSGPERDVRRLLSAFEAAGVTVVLEEPVSVTV